MKNKSPESIERFKAAGLLINNSKEINTKKRGNDAGFKKVHKNQVQVETKEIKRSMGK